MISHVGGGHVGSDMLLERTAELAQLTEAVAATATGAPRVVMLEGSAGIGKTALLQAARGRADRAGFRVLTARGGELERERGSGIARQLFEPLLVRTGNAQRSKLPQRPAAKVIRLFGLDGTEPDPSADEYDSQNALYWLCARLAERAPMMIAIDDLHWSDATSLTGWPTWSAGSRICRSCWSWRAGPMSRAPTMTCWRASRPSRWFAQSGPGRSPSAPYVN
jgi:hypothetical protein